MAVGTEAGGDERRGQESPLAVSCLPLPAPGRAWGEEGTGGHSWAKRAEAGVGKRQTDRQRRTQRHTHSEGGRRKGRDGKRDRGKEREQAGGGGGTAQRRKEGRRGQGSRRRGAVWRGGAQKRKRSESQRTEARETDSGVSRRRAGHVPCALPTPALHCAPL